MPDAAHTNQCDDSQLTHTHKKSEPGKLSFIFFALANSRTIPIWYTSFLQSTSSIGHIPMANYFYIFNGVLRLVGVLFVSCPHHPLRHTHTHTHTRTQCRSIAIVEAILNSMYNARMEPTLFHFVVLLVVIFLLPTLVSDSPHLISSSL